MALEGIRVLDLSQRAPGPYCTMLLGDLGADVVVVEAPPGVGRRLEVAVDERARAFNALGRNKRSIALNLKDEAARNAFHRLAETADVVLEGFRPGVVKRLGVDYETIRKLKPDIVYCALSGYGQDGPYAGLPGHDINYIGLGGALGLTGRSGSPPSIPMNVVADFGGGGLYAAFAIVTALFVRQRTGRGQYIDMAMTDGVISLLAATASQFFSGGHVPRPGQELLNGGAPFYNVYETADGRWLAIGCLEPWFWENLCRALECEQFIPHQHDRDRFPEMFATLRERFKTKPRDQWFQELRGQDVCVAPVYSLDEVFSDPHVQARGMIAELMHPELGKLRQVGVAPKFSETPGSLRRTAPRRGEHTEEVLLDIGYTEEEVAALRETGAAD